MRFSMLGSAAAALATLLAQQDLPALALAEQDWALAEEAMPSTKMKEKKKIAFFMSPEMFLNVGKNMLSKSAPKVADF
jgi:hypothetical protein